MEDAQCPLCRATTSELVSLVPSKPTGETDYGISVHDYRREIRKCIECEVYFNHYDFSLLSANFYEGSYNGAIEGGRLDDRFKRITELPFDKSDNKQRVARIIDFLRDSFGEAYKDCSLLDVGTGTGVFMYEASKYLNDISCVDPDARAIDQVRKRVPTAASWVGSLEAVPGEKKFNIVTFNKVLEHIRHPLEVLTRARQCLASNAFIYIELPFSDLIIESGTQNARAEFFVEHFTVFNERSLSYLVVKSGYEVVRMRTLVEPSGKHTIYAFVRP